MQPTQITLHGRVYNMPSNFKVLQEITTRVCDPLKVLAEAGRSGGNMVNLPLSQEQCITLLTIGVRHSGQLSEPDESVSESIYALGAGTYTPLAVVYLAALCGGGEAKAVSPKAQAAHSRKQK